MTKRRKRERLAAKLKPVVESRLLYFVEEPGFTDDWSDLDLDVENDLWELQDQIMDAPTRPSVISGTGSLRKIRFAPGKWNTGKRGAVRVCYVLFETRGIVLLCMAYGKGEKANLTSQEKIRFKALVARIDKQLKTRKPSR